MKMNIKLAVAMTIAILASANINIDAQNSARHGNTRAVSVSRPAHHAPAPQAHPQAHPQARPQVRPHHVPQPPQAHHRPQVACCNHPNMVVYRDVHHVKPIRHIVHRNHRYVVYDRFYAPQPQVVGAIYTTLPVDAVCVVRDGRICYSALGFTFDVLNIAGQIYYQLID